MATDPSGRQTPAYQNFWAWSQHQPEREAIAEASGRTCTYGELRQRSNQVTHGLRALGLQFDDGVAVLVPNVIEYYEVWLAVAQSGAHFTPINSHLTADEVAYVLQNSGAKAFIAHERFADLARAAAQQAALPAEGCFSIGAITGFQSYQSWRDDCSRADPPDRSAGTSMIYSSGTTGVPKGVRKKLLNAPPEDARATFVFALASYDIGAGDEIFLVQGPLHHAGPWCYSIASLHLGHRLVLMDKWDAELSLQLFEKYGVTHTMMVPTMFHRLLKLPSAVRGRYDLRSLKAINHSAAPCPLEIKREMLAWLGPIIHEAYGGTEGAGTRCPPQDWLRKPGTVGRAVAGVDIKILNEQGEPMPPGEAGDVYLSSLPGIDPTYYKDDEKTARSRRGCYYTIGDMGYLDEEGFLFLIDRRADMIISGGVNIYPAEIEARLSLHPKVADVAVFGVPNAEWGEEVKAVVQPIDSVAASDSLAQELTAYALQHLAKYKVPRSFDFSTSLPRSENGKIYKRLLRDPYWRGQARRI